MNSLKKVILIIALLNIVSSQFYSQHTKCSHNELSFDSELALFYQNTQYSGVSMTQVIDVMGFVKKLYHYGKKVDQNYQESHRCAKYFMSQQICCRYQDLDAFTNKIIDLYKRTYYTSKHPMVNYLYRIYDQYKALNSYCLSNYKFYLPQRDYYTKDNATQSLVSLFNKIQAQLAMVKQFQIEFIYNTACVLCVGIEDFKTFLHPVHVDTNKTKRLIYNEGYWNNLTQFIATRILNAKLYADQLESFINTQLKPKLTTYIECIPLNTLINDQTEISKRKVCQTNLQCIQFAEKYIGGPAAPAYSKAFTSIEQKRSLTKTNPKIVTSSDCGYRGNTTYTRYTKATLPVVLIKGNEYTYA